MKLYEELENLIAANETESFSFARLCKHFGLRAAYEKQELESALIALFDDGKIYLSERFSASSLLAAGVSRGVLQGNERGFCFFVPDGEGESDLFIPNSALYGAMHGDKVLARKIKREGDEGEVVKILERGVTEIVGLFKIEKGNAFVIPDDRRYFCDIHVERSRAHGAKNFDKVLCAIIAYPKNKKNPEGSVKEVLGNSRDKGVDVLSVIKSHGIPTDFSESTEIEAKNAPKEVSKDSLKGRRDLTKKRIFTIDGEDAKDLDDAISVERLKNGNYLLGVHIADVTEYVKENSSVDLEARDRATSVYFVDRVVPMLPVEFSNGICSLNGGVVRLTLSCEMEIDKSGKVVSHDIFESYIKSCHRSTYTDVTKVLENDPEATEKYADISEDIFLSKELSDLLAKKRRLAGSIDFDTKEAQITVDKKGVAIDVRPRVHDASAKIIEQFMITANETVAEHAYWLELPFVYRVHGKISEDRFAAFTAFVNALGIPFRPKYEKLKSKSFADLLSKIEGNVLYLIVNKVLLRSMQKATYSEKSGEHFGLASENYCHFTSPIRRYPDLFVHRMIKKQLHGEQSENSLEAARALAVLVAKHSTEAEIRADNAEREVDDIKKAEYMISHIGEEFDGVVSGVTSFGVFVELANTCEGLVRTAMLPADNYVYNEKMFELAGASHRYRLGDTMRISVVGSDKKSGKVEFAAIGEEYERDSRQ